MPLRYDTEVEQEELRGRRSGAALGRAVGTDTEIALGTRSLLAIFFGLVLICAVFFGLGYSVGRASGTRAAEPPATETASSAADSHPSKPSPDQTLTPVETPPSAASDGGTPSAENPPETQATAPRPATATAPASSTPASTPVNPFQSPSTSAATAPAARAATLQPVVATTATSLMVQVAAVRVPQDAQILVDALKKHGYAAVVRNEPQDQLLHIQLGPFATRADATAMRTKLLGDGYNAVVK
jgi:cell division septation protein DedD